MTVVGFIVLNEDKTETYYPFMVACPNCGGPGFSEVGHDAVRCHTCDGSGRVRNPALEWRWLCEHDMYQYTEQEAAEIAHDCQGEMHPWIDVGCRWGAVGVKESRSTDHDMPGPVGADRQCPYPSVDGSCDKCGWRRGTGESTP